MLSCYSFHNHTLLSHSMWSLWNLRSLRVFQGDGSYHWRLGDAFKISWVNWCLEHAPGKTLNTENLPDLLGTLTLCYTHTYFALISGFIWDFTFLIPTIRVPHAFLSDWRVCVQAQTYQRGNSNSDGPAFIPSLAFLSSAASETSRCETATYHYVCMYVCMMELTQLHQPCPWREAWPRSGWAWCLWRCFEVDRTGGCILLGSLSLEIWVLQFLPSFPLPWFWWWQGIKCTAGISVCWLPKSPHKTPLAHSPSSMRVVINSHCFGSVALSTYPGQKQLILIRGWRTSFTRVPMPKLEKQVQLPLHSTHLKFHPILLKKAKCSSSLMTLEITIWPSDPWLWVTEADHLSWFAWDWGVTWDFGVFDAKSGKVPSNPGQVGQFFRTPAVRTLLCAQDRVFPWRLGWGRSKKEQEFSSSPHNWTVFCCSC